MKDTRSGGLREHWKRAQVRHLLSPEQALGAGMEEARRLDVAGLDRRDLEALATTLLQERETYQARMIDKAKVAEIAGMTVSWLDNSQSEKAVRLRELGVRYGTRHNSPVRYPLAQVIELCTQPENELHPKP